ncbi:methyltransferase [Gordonia sp. HY442]|uniref:methyltransferase n=1 Tax=Gordonia zhenghanii TaxID=2911516 RepID=UPI001F01728C|nr:methyltransferase [Gordonia zhenghanii]MCF8603701.1 methyltransferase [Gordonia zhenghanii]
MITEWTAGERATDAILTGIPVPRPVIEAIDGVYRPSVDSALLCKHAVAESSGPGTDRRTVTELCAGSGIASIYAALAGAEVTAVDDRPAAIAAVGRNAARNQLRVDTVLADVRTWTPHAPADVVVANPPYVPAPAEATDDGHAWNAGPDGRAVLDPLIDHARHLVAAGGVLILVYSAVAGVSATLDGLRRNGFDAGVVDEVQLEFGPVMLGRVQWLAANGLIDGDQSEERLVVVRAVRSR